MSPKTEPHYFVSAIYFEFFWLASSANHVGTKTLEIINIIGLTVSLISVISVINNLLGECDGTKHLSTYYGLVLFDN